MNVSTAEMFITVFYATINTQTRRMKYVRAGHDRPIHYQGATSKITLLDAPGRFLGLLPDLIVEERELIIESGDTLVCYSDGVTDAVRPGDGDMYGLERLSKIVFHEGHRPAQEIVDAIVADVDRFRDGEDQPDDLTLLVVKAL
jgi:phosphoserine phosphatase RsbU/P